VNPDSPGPRFSPSLDRTSSRYRDWTFLLVLLVLLSVPWLKNLRSGELDLFFDEARHAINGAFLMDYVRDLKWSSPVQYACQYYGKYPAIAIGRWPPLFYLVEAAFFAIFGISPWVGRLAVLLFAAMAVLFWYKIAREYVRPELAAASTLLYACLPSVLRHEKSIMLEIPCLALCLGAIYCWVRLLKTGQRHLLYGAALFSAAALLTKQTAIFLFPFFVLHLFVERKWNLLRWKHSYFALAGAAVLVAPWYLFLLRILPGVLEPVAGDFLHGHRTSLLSPLKFYPATLPDQLGLLLLVLSLAGLVALMLARNYPCLRFFLTWILACYLTFTLLSEKVPRHIVAWLLPFTFLAVYGVWRLLSHWPRLAIVGLAGLAAWFYVGAFRYQGPTLVGFEEASRYLSEQPDSDLLFYQGSLNRHFVFFVRKFDPDKRRLVLRERFINANLSPRPAHGVFPTAEEVAQLLRNTGIRYVVVESRDVSVEVYDYLFDRRLLQVTKAALQSDQFELVKRVPIRANDNRLEGLQLLIYRVKEPLEPKLSVVVIPVPINEGEIRLSLSELSGHPWPQRR
jgi:hypothetical protein